MENPVMEGPRRDGPKGRNNLGNRILRALKLDKELYEEVEADPSSMGQAMTVVALSIVASGIGSLGLVDPETGRAGFSLPGLFLGLLVGFLSWFLWALVAYLIGTKLLPGRATSSNLRELLRCTGFAAAPGLFKVLGLIPVPGLWPLVQFVTSLWMLLAFILALKQALDYEGYGRAVAVAFLGWLVMFLLSYGLYWMWLGGRMTV